MRHILNIQLCANPGAVLRAIGLMERRGFRLLACQVAEAAGDGQGMTATVESDRPAELLQRQLERLHDVLWVELKQPAVHWKDRAGARPIGGSQ